MQRGKVLVNICTTFCFSRLRLSVRVQGADTGSFRAGATVPVPAMNYASSVSPALYSNDTKVKLKGGKKIYCEETTSTLLVANLGLVLPQAATWCFMRRLGTEGEGKVALQVWP